MMEVQAVKLTEQDLVKAAILLMKEQGITPPKNDQLWEVLWFDAAKITVTIGNKEVTK